VSLLKPWVESDPELFPEPRDVFTHPGPIVEDEGHDQYLVEAIIRGPSKYRGRIRYKVRWQGYGPEWDSWVAVDDIHPGLIAEYNAMQPAPRTRRR
jgi:hypothetical protein